MPRFKPISIKREGLKNYLDRTADQHDGYNYAVFVRELDKGQNHATLARMFKVTRNTVYKWARVRSSEVNQIVAEKAVDELRNV